jgi:adenylate cyclase
MNVTDLDAIGAWLVDRGLAGASETELLHGFCERCNAAGLDVSRAVAIIDTLHPTFEGRAVRWRNDGIEETAFVEYGRTDAGEAAASWQRNAFHHMLTQGLTALRQRLTEDPLPPLEPFATLRDHGYTDYLGLVPRFAGSGAIGEMDCLYSLWATRRAGGFAEDDISALKHLVPALALALKCVSMGRIAATLAEVYLGRDAGHRVLNGTIARGVAERIGAVLWFSDLRGYTKITDTAPADEVIPLLNDYADLVISAVQNAGGDVLKLIGDGTLAIFKADDPAEACRSALKAEAALRHALAALNQRRAGEGRPVTSVYLGLHIGEVFYGNIGSENRLDFTVVGPAVNEAGRIAAMCRSVDRGVVISADFAAATPEPERSTLVSVGRYALRGVGRAQELFTLDPGML